jgi:membrane fusion protein (multidrug efflux system)
VSNKIAVIADDEQAARIRRIGAAAVWIDVQVIPDLARALFDRPILQIGDPERDDDPRVAYVARAALPDDQLQAVIAAVATGSAVAPAASPAPPQSQSEARRAQLAFAASRKLAAATDLASTESIAVETLIELLDVERAHCLFYNGEDGALWSEARERAGGDERRASGGLVGWSARTGLPSSAAIAGDDPRYVGAIDDPEGDPASQILVQPIIGADARVHAILIAIRRSRRAPLGAPEAAVLARFAGLAAPLLDQLSTHVEGQQLLEADADPLFRREAVEAANAQRWGDVVRVTPSWLSWSYWILVVLLAASIVFVALGTISTYSAGPAVIRSMARTALTARTSGNIAAVDVSPGDRVAAGTLIAELDDVDQRASVDRISREFEAQLRNHMQDPADLAADSAVSSLRLQLEQSRTSLEERAIRAGAGGVISDVRIRPGQHVEPGDIAASIVDGNAGLEVVALLPGEDRPQLAPNMVLRLELAGYRYAYQSLVIDSISSDVIAPTEARRVLGAEVADSLRLGGPVVLVRGRLSSPNFEVDGKTYTYHDGMLGNAEVSVREERILFALVPGLRKVL